MHVIRWAEFFPIGDRPSDYTTMFGGDQFSSTNDHPRKSNTRWGYTSTAAGAYMILETTWDEVVKKLKLPDFSPASQDRAAIELISRRHALDLIRQGKFDQAVQTLRNEWTSLPGASQSRVTLQLAEQKFTDAGGVIDEGKKTK